MDVVKVSSVNCLGKTNGCEFASDEILNSLKSIYSNEKGELLEFNLEEIKLDGGNVCEKIFSESKKFFGEKVIFLGGDHSISYPLGKSFLNYCLERGEKFCLIVFDAHPDLMGPVDKNVPTSREWLRSLVNSGFPSENILLVGCRNSHLEEIDFAKKSGIRMVPISNLREDLEFVCHSIMEFASGKKLYVSLDIDVVDPVFAPGTGNLEVGGLTSREIIYLIQKINLIKGLSVVDIVEVNPSKDEMGLTCKLGAKILGELL